jgi:hypothetical protein
VTEWRLVVRDYPNAPAPPTGGWQTSKPGTLTTVEKLVAKTRLAYVPRLPDVPGRYPDVPARGYKLGRNYLVLVLPT